MRRLIGRIRSWASDRRVVAHVAVDSPAANFPIGRAMRARRGAGRAPGGAADLGVGAGGGIGKLRRQTTPGAVRAARSRSSGSPSGSVPARFIGHPAVNRTIDLAALRDRMHGLPQGAPRLGIFPGSRGPRGPGQHEPARRRLRGAAEPPRGDVRRHRGGQPGDGADHPSSRERLSHRPAHDHRLRRRGDRLVRPGPGGLRHHHPRHRGASQADDRRLQDGAGVVDPRQAPDTACRIGCCRTSSPSGRSYRSSCPTWAARCPDRQAARRGSCSTRSTARSRARSCTGCACASAPTSRAGRRPGRSWR